MVWEDSTCYGAAKLTRHNYWAHALEPTNCNCWACMSLRSMLCNARRSPHTATRERPHAAIKTQGSQKKTTGRFGCWWELSVTGFRGPCLLVPLGRDLCLSLSVSLSSCPIWSPIPSWEPHPHDLISSLEPHCPNTITLGVRASYIHFGRDTIQSTAHPVPGDLCRALENTFCPQRGSSPSRTSTRRPG